MPSRWNTKNSKPLARRPSQVNPLPSVQSRRRSSTEKELRSAEVDTPSSARRRSPKKRKWNKGRKKNIEKERRNGSKNVMSGSRRRMSGRRLTTRPNLNQDQSQTTELTTELTMEPTHHHPHHQVVTDSLLSSEPLKTPPRVQRSIQRMRSVKPNTRSKRKKRRRKPIPGEKSRMNVKNNFLFSRRI
jgi:hypothetical protein